MTKNMMRGIAFLAGLGTMVLAGCSSIKSATMIDASVPMKEQSTLIAGSGLESLTIDGEATESFGEIYIPSGSHEIRFYVNATRSIPGTYQEYRLWTKDPISFSRDFEAGHTYEIQIQVRQGPGERTSAYGTTVYHEGNYHFWVELNDITDSYKGKPIPVALGAPRSGVLTNWDRPAGLYLQSAADVGAYFSYHDITDFSREDRSSDGDNKVSHSGPFQAGAVGMYLQLGLETGYNKIGFALLGDAAGGLGYNGLSSFGFEWELGFLGKLYYDKIIGIGLGTGLWSAGGTGSFYHRAMLSLFPTVSSFMNDINLYFDYFPNDNAWGAGIRWTAYLRGQPISGKAKKLR